jgi:hypothetical protein
MSTNYLFDYKTKTGVYVDTLNKSKWHYFNGVLHRLDGPAIEYESGVCYWVYNGKHIACESQEEFERIVKLLVFI